MTEEQLKDIILWDRINWSKALPFWQKAIANKPKLLNCIELGGREGGLSLWLALQGHQVICSDLENPQEIAKPLHDKHSIDSITYQSINAIDIPYENEFDIVAFKSIVGGICRKGNNISKEQVIGEMFKVLKPGGTLLFAENLSSSAIHKFFRKKFTRWGAEWDYLDYKDIDQLFSSFSKIEYFTVGFFGAFGRSEGQRVFLGKMDNIFEKLIPKNLRYIVIGVATK